MALPTAGGPQSCQVEGCQGRAATRTEMRVHFFCLHVQDTLVILEEGNLPPPTFPSMQHAGPMVCSERKAPFHRSVRQGGGAKEKIASVGGTAGDLG